MRKNELLPESTKGIRYKEADGTGEGSKSTVGR